MKEIPILFTRHERGIESYTTGFYDQMFSYKAIDLSLTSHDIQWINKESSCILLRSSMSNVSSLKIHNDFVTRKKSFLTDDGKNPIRQIRSNDRLNINADM